VNLNPYGLESPSFKRGRTSNTQILTATEKLRRREPQAQHGAEAPVFGRLGRAGEVRATFSRLPSRSLTPTALAPEQADTLAARLADVGHSLPYVTADHRLHVYRLGTPTAAAPGRQGTSRGRGGS